MTEQVRNALNTMRSALKNDPGTYYPYEFYEYWLGIIESALLEEPTANDLGLYK